MRAVSFCCVTNQLKITTRQKVTSVTGLMACWARLRAVLTWQFFLVLGTVRWLWSWGLKFLGHLEIEVPSRLILGSAQTPWFSLSDVPAPKNTSASCQPDQVLRRTAPPFLKATLTYSMRSPAGLHLYVLKIHGWNVKAISLSPSVCFHVNTFTLLLYLSPLMVNTH